MTRLDPRAAGTDELGAPPSVFGCAIRALEEQSSLARRLAARSHEQAQGDAHARFVRRAEEAERHVEFIRRLLGEEPGATAPVTRDATARNARLAG
jgi:Ni,Fe-hydrogenase III large subunit